MYFYHDPRVFSISAYTHTHIHIKASGRRNYSTVNDAILVERVKMIYLKKNHSVSKLPTVTLSNPPHRTGVRQWTAPYRRIYIYLYTFIISRPLELDVST